MLRTITGLFGVSALLIGFGFAGCSSTADRAATSGPDSSRKSTQPEIRKTQAQGSIEDMRRGVAPATPKDSPLKEIHFAFDSYDLRTDARATLKANAEWLRKNPAVRVDIEGHCDERGTTEYNLALGAKRAQAAADYLVALGVRPDRLAITSYGEEAPVCRENREGCWQRNRRDRFVARAEKPGV
jgi:peptidoglycan-associated lipoprotein